MAETPTVFTYMKDSWCINVSGSPMFSIVPRNKIMKSVVSAWNKERYGNIQEQIRVTQIEICQSQSFLLNDNARARDQILRAILNWLLDCEETGLKTPECAGYKWGI